MLHAEGVDAFVKAGMVRPKVVQEAICPLTYGGSGGLEPIVLITNGQNEPCCGEGKPGFLKHAIGGNVPHVRTLLEGRLNRIHVGFLGVCKHLILALSTRMHRRLSQGLHTLRIRCVLERHQGKNT